MGSGDPLKLPRIEVCPWVRVPCSVVLYPQILSRAGLPSRTRCPEVPWLVIPRSAGLLARAISVSGAAMELFVVEL